MWKFAKETIVENGIELLPLDCVSEREVVLLKNLLGELDTIDEFCTLKVNFDFAYEFFDRFFSTFNSGGAPTLTEVAYRLKIFLYAGYEYIETVEELLQQLYPNKVLSEDGKTTVHEGAARFKKVIKSIYDDNFSYRLCYNLRNHLQHYGSSGLSFHRNATGNHVVLSSHAFAQRDRYVQKRFCHELLEKPDETIDVIEQLHNYKQNMDSLYFALFTSCWEVFMDRQTVIHMYLDLLFQQKSLCKSKVYCIFETVHASNESGNTVVIYKKQINFTDATESIEHFRRTCGESNYHRLLEQAKQIISEA